MYWGKSLNIPSVKFKSLVNIQGPNNKSPSMTATILGTIGHVYGALVGGLVIGVAQQVSTAWLLPTYKPAVAFMVMILILLIRPKGIFGGARE